MGEIRQPIAEICCGSFYDAKQSWLGGAKRIELNSALHLGGLTPTTAALALTKEHTGLKVITMVRPRGAGFCYGEEDFQVMLAECRELLKQGADGVAFGCLNPDATLNMDQNEKMIDLVKSRNKEAVFHRAFDCSSDPYQTMEKLIRMGADRVLTSGLQPKAMDGIALILELQTRYGQEIELLAGSGINASNARRMIEETGIFQVHSSCKAWVEDATTSVNRVSYSYAGDPNASCYEVVSKTLVEKLLEEL